MRNFDANTFNRTVLLCHMKHAKTEFMYLPILLTLEQAWQSSGARVHRASSTKRMAALTAGDVVVWVGMGRAAGSVPWADLGKRGVLRVQYQTEPFGDRCRFDSVWHGARDEIWDYSRHNVELCTSARNGGGDPISKVPYRYVPPGAFSDASLPERKRFLPEPPADAALASTAAFLGAIPSNSTPGMPGYARRRCFATLKAELGAGLRHADSAYTAASLRGELLKHRVFVNLHKDCGSPLRPAEAVRFAVLLAVGARVVSEHANPADEREFEGLVEFVPLADLAQATTRALAAEAGSAAAQAQSDRIAIFRERFAPSTIFERFLRPALATATVAAAPAAAAAPSGGAAKPAAAKLTAADISAPFFASLPPEAERHPPTFLPAAGTPSVGGGPCAGAPFTYRGGAMEARWLETPAAGRICRTAREQVADAQTCVAFAAAAAGSPWRVPFASEAPLLSSFACADGGGTEWLEPLSGMARHPLAQTGCRLSREHDGARRVAGVLDRKRPLGTAEVDLYNISHLVLANRCPVQGDAEARARGRRRPSALSARIGGASTTSEAPLAGRSLLFDLGCSWYWKPALCEYRPDDRRCDRRKWSAPPPPPPPAHATSMAASVYAAAGGSAVGPSLPLFLSLYERNCIRFDHAYGWEATKFDEALWWRHVPADVRPRLTFYNEPVTAAAFVDHLASHTRPEDFVVLKVDIDGGPEVEIVEEIARRPELAARVDELFFEYHFDFDGLDFGWHIRRPGARRRFRYDTVSNASVDDALGLMRRLREAGVRSHFWV